jgi:hypothetical protein
MIKKPDEALVEKKKKTLTDNVCGDVGSICIW